MTTKRSSISKEAIETIKIILSLLNTNMVLSYNPLVVNDEEFIRLISDIEKSKIEIGLYRDNNIFKDLSKYFKRYDLKIVDMENDYLNNNITIKAVGIYNNVVKMESIFIMEHKENLLLLKSQYIKKVLRIRSS